MIRRDISAEQLSVNILRELTGLQPLKQVRFRFWNGSYWPDGESRPATLVLNQPGSLRQMLAEGTELALAEAYLRNDFDVEGDLEAAFEFAEILRSRTLGWSKKLNIGRLLRHLPNHARPRRPILEHQANFIGRKHSLSRDQDATRFHYDVSNDFYSLWLDPQLVYSCAYFDDPESDLEEAQRKKLDYICRKLRLEPGQRILDVGCGWGGLVLHAALHYGVKATGITLSEPQAQYARDRAGQLKLQDQVDVRVQDYRTLREPADFDAIVSVGMVEHVGARNLPSYFRLAHDLLKPGGLFLNHGIGTGPVPLLTGSPSFIEKYVFPDGELVPLAETLRPAELAGFEVRDVENLREHYTMTLRHWVRRLEARHAEALKFVSEPVYRIWRLYMAGSAHGFKVGNVAVYQTLLAKLDSEGRANLPLSRAAWYRR